MTSASATECKERTGPAGRHRCRRKRPRRLRTTRKRYPEVLFSRRDLSGERPNFLRLLTNQESSRGLGGARIAVGHRLPPAPGRHGPADSIRTAALHAPRQGLLRSEETEGLEPRSLAHSSTLRDGERRTELSASEAKNCAYVRGQEVPRGARDGERGAHRTWMLKVCCPRSPEGTFNSFLTLY